MQLSFEETRVLGVLMEKAFATPEQYPMTVNALVNGCNQKNCRDPVSQMGEEAVLDALDRLRRKELVTLVRAAGGRTDRYKHRARDTLNVEGKEAALLAELLLRGPQTDGELRQRAIRLQSFESIEEVSALLDSLRNRPEPLVRRLGREERRRGVKYSHNFYPDGEEPEEMEADPPVRSSWAPAAGPGTDVEDLRREIEDLKARVEALEERVESRTGETG